MTAVMPVVPPTRLIHFGFYSNKEQADLNDGHAAKTDFYKCV